MLPNNNDNLPDCFKAFYQTLTGFVKTISIVSSLNYHHCMRIVWSIGSKVNCSSTRPRAENGRTVYIYLIYILCRLAANKFNKKSGIESSCPEDVVALEVANLDLKNITSPICQCVRQACHIYRNPLSNYDNS